MRKKTYIVLCYDVIMLWSQCCGGPLSAQCSKAGVFLPYSLQQLFRFLCCVFRDYKRSVLVLALQVTCQSWSTGCDCWTRPIPAPRFSFRKRGNTFWSLPVKFTFSAAWMTSESGQSVCLFHIVALLQIDFSPSNFQFKLYKLNYDWPPSGNSGTCIV